MLKAKEREGKRATTGSGANVASEVDHLIVGDKVAGQTYAENEAGDRMSEDRWEALMTGDQGDVPIAEIDPAQWTADIDKSVEEVMCTP